MDDLSDGYILYIFWVWIFAFVGRAVPYRAQLFFRRPAGDSEADTCFNWPSANVIEVRILVTWPPDAFSGKKNLPANWRKCSPHLQVKKSTKSMAPLLGGDQIYGTNFYVGKMGIEKSATRFCDEQKWGTLCSIIKTDSWAPYYNSFLNNSSIRKQS